MRTMITGGALAGRRAAPGAGVGHAARRAAAWQRRPGDVPLRRGYLETSDCWSSAS